MEKHLQLSDSDFEQQFLDLFLTPSWFTHEAHLRLAWILIRKYGVSSAQEKLCQQIQAFDQKHGDGTVYNKTVTIAAVHIVKHFIDKATGNGFLSLIQEFPRLKQNFKGLVETHYSVNIFKDPAAKIHYLAPDLMPFT